MTSAAQTSDNRFEVDMSCSFLERVCGDDVLPVSAAAGRSLEFAASDDLFPTWVRRQSRADSNSNAGARTVRTPPVVDTMPVVAAKRGADEERLRQMRALRDAICLAGSASGPENKPRDSKSAAAADPAPHSALVHERPIAFNDGMMRALLAGRKLQTRRLVVPAVHEARPTASGVDLFDAEQRPIACRLGRAGDVLWVRERWAVAVTSRPGGAEQFVYSADLTESWPVPTPAVRWRPSYQMPRVASRVMLQIEDIRAERICEISEDDARAEGFDGSSQSGPLEWFRTLWDKINAAPGTRWKDNPWVWAIRFQRVALPPPRGT